ncbi:hypothetical protein C8J57DRAFT_1725210 [Mycena rebaudengoi]|nr:hypothetical protein C8J57DRAFT_1725210 [Mycena rebaudengoi]
MIDEQLMKRAGAEHESRHVHVDYAVHISTTAAHSSSPTTRTSTASSTSLSAARPRRGAQNARRHDSRPRTYRQPCLTEPPTAAGSGAMEKARPRSRRNVWVDDVAYVCADDVAYSAHPCPPLDARPRLPQLTLQGAQTRRRRRAAHVSTRLACSAQSKAGTVREVQRGHRMKSARWHIHVDSVSHINVHHSGHDARHRMHTSGRKAPNPVPRNTQGEGARRRSGAYVAHVDSVAYTHVDSGADVPIRRSVAQRRNASTAQKRTTQSRVAHKAKTKAYAQGAERMPPTNCPPARNVDVDDAAYIVYAAQGTYTHAVAHAVRPRTRRAGIHRKPRASPLPRRPSRQPPTARTPRAGHTERQKRGASAYTRVARNDARPSDRATRPTAHGGMTRVRRGSKVSRIRSHSRAAQNDAGPHHTKRRREVRARRAEDVHRQGATPTGQRARGPKATS